MAADVPEIRDSTIDRMAETEVDMLVVGGGVVGAGAALDAVTRGLTTASSKRGTGRAGRPAGPASSSTAACATWRVLDFGLVREALHERGLLLDRLAPHLVSRCPFLYPLTSSVASGPTSAAAWPCTTRWRSPARPAGCDITGT